MRNAIFTACVGVIVVGCAAKPQAASRAAQPAAPAVASATDASKNKVIVHIVSQQQTITVTSSPTGLLYSLKDASGNVMIADASEQKFAELEPALYRNIKNYIAVHADDAPIPSAGIDAPIPTADVRRDGPSLNGQPRSFRGSIGGSNDSFQRTSERPFPTAREDAPE